MDGPEIEAAIAELQGLQEQAAPSVPSSQPPSGPRFVSYAYVPQATEVQLRHLSSSDPDPRISKIESFWRKKFESQWSDSSKQAHVTDIFLVGQYGPTAMKHKAAFDQYSRQVQSHMPNGQSAVSYTFHGTKRACKVGENSTELYLCNLQNCALCSIMRMSFQLKYVGSSAGTRFGAGFYSSPDSYKANDYARNLGSGVTKHAILLCSVVTGKKQVLYNSDFNRTGPDRGYDSVEGNPTRTSGTRLVETIVFKEDAIMPHALITFDFQAHSKPSAGLTLVDSGVYTITNVKFNTAMDLNTNTDRVIGFRKHGRDNQQWVFKQQPTGGWMIHNKAAPNRFLGVSPLSHQNRTLINGVSFNDAMIWEIQPAMNGTYRMAIYDMIGKCVDLSMSDGSKNGGRIWIFDHIVNGENQRWKLDYVGYDPSDQGHTSTPAGQNGPTQTPVDGGVYIMTNDRYNSAMDLNERNNDVQGWRQNGRPNQNWIFHRSGSGWKIESEANQMYIGLAQSNRSNGNPCVAVDRSDATVWDIQEAINGSVRIATADSASMNLDLSVRDQKHIILFYHGVNARQQRWYLQRVR